MKKLLYILAISFVTAISVTSCTEENVTPSADASFNGGGGASDPK